MNRRRAIAGQSNLLPAGYTEVKCLIANRHHYITTEYTPQPGDTLILENVEDMNNDVLDIKSIVVFSTTYSTINWILTVITKPLASTPDEFGSLYYKYFRSGDATLHIAKNILKAAKHTIVCDSKVYIDGNEIMEDAGTASPTSGTLRFFAHSDASPQNMSRCFRGSIGRAYIVQDGKEKPLIIPCLDRRGIPCAYDLYSHATRYNEGTGLFGYETLTGQIVNPT